MKWLRDAAIIGAAFAVMVAVILWQPARSQVGPVNQIFCNQIATLAVGSTGDVQVVAAVTNQRVYICGWHMTNTGAAGTFAFDQGTGSNCGTGKVAIVPPQNVTSNAPSADHIDFAQFQTTQSQAFCINPSVNTVAGLVYFAQF